ncbi:SDR family NAD(P)-dependent oxidoreductase [Variovorax sp.]|uniref:SDR family NAD(P)-dependent oxidoreductase n=1 Tax=Variovorax sp. TaxID=1871043 RepID=UPI0037D9CC52
MNETNRQEECIVLNLGIEGKIAVVTGGGLGLGRSYALTLASHGVAVAVADLDEDNAAAVVEEIHDSGGKAIHVHVDVSDDLSVKKMSSSVVDRLGGIDILVNNAGWRPFSDGVANDDLPVSDHGIDDWRRVFAINVFGVLACTRACRPAMIARGGGVVVNQSSMSAYRQPASSYAVSKVTVSALTISLAVESAAHNIRVNGIAPGNMTALNPDTTRLTSDFSRMVHKRLGDRLNAELKMQLIKRQGLPEDLSGALLYLVSDMSSFVTGTNMIVDGGLTLQV